MRFFLKMGRAAIWASNAMDGPTTARRQRGDRDWLRQKVLEGLGWKIQRVWSTAWVRNPEAEMARIEAALIAARARPTFDPDRPSVTAPSSNPKDLDVGTVEIVAAAPPAIHLEYYEDVRLPKRPRWAELRSETTETLAHMVTLVADLEGPVHKDVVIERIRRCYGIGRVRGSTRHNVERVIQLAQSSGTVQETELSSGVARINFADSRVRP